MRASAPSPSEPAKQRLARPGLMSAGPAATALLGAASYRGMVPSPAATATSTRHHAAWISQMQLGPTNASTATWMQRLLPRVGPRVSSLPCWRSFLGSSWQMPTPARARDATTRRLIDATARSPKQSAWLGKVTGLTRADPAMPPPTSSIPIARGNTLGVALMRPVMRASAPSPSGPATRQRARPGPMSAGRAATALLGAASYRGMARSPAATATSTRARAPLTSLTQLGPTSASSAKRIPCRRMWRRLWTMGASGLLWPSPFPSQSL